MAFAFVPSNADQVDVQFGIDHEFTNYIVQDEKLTEGADDYRIHDQKGKLAQIHAYQRYWNMSFSLVGPVDAVPTHAGATFQWYKPGSNTKIDFYIDKCELTSTYNDTAKWSVEGEAYQSAVYSDETGDGGAST